MTDFAKRIVLLALFAALTIFTSSLCGVPEATAQSLKTLSGSFEKSSQAGDHVAAERTANAIPHYEGALKIFEKKLELSNLSVIGVAENLVTNPLGSVELLV